MTNECVKCGKYKAEFWVCDDCQAIDMDPASDHDSEAYLGREADLAARATPEEQR